MKYSKFLTAAAAVLIIVILYGCSFSTAGTKMVTPEIRALGLPDPSIVESVTLRVSGPDMDPLEVNYSIVPSVINLAIPEGNERTFELTVGLTADFTAPPAITYTSFRGKAIADITSDSAVVTLNMGLGSTKLIVPDYDGSRLLQFDDINDTVATVLDSANPAFNTFLTANMLSFGIYDVDFDKDGRIFIAENGFGSGQGVVRVDNILGTNPSWFGSTHAGIIALTVDRSNSLLYYSNGSGIYKSDLDGNGELTLIIDTGVASIQTIRGMTISESGLIYITGTTPATTPTVFQYNPDLELVTAYYTMPNPITIFPWDVLAKDDLVYVTNPNGADGWKIIQLNNDLTSPIGYGIFKTTAFSVYDTSPGHFYDPRCFVAVLNKEITIIDDSSTEGSDKLVSIDDITGANWKTLPTADKGQGLFEFFFGC